VLVAIAASPLFPVGLGRLAETEVGVHVDAATFALVGGGLCVALGALTAVLAWTSTSRRTTAVRPAHRGRSQVVAWSSPVSTFARHLAFPRAPRAARVSATSTAFGLALAVAGLLAALTVQTSVGATVASPERWGWNWDSAVELDDAVPVAEIVERADVQAAALGTIAKIELDGRQAGGFALEPVRGDLRFTIVRGRLPVSGDEVALGAETLSELGVDVGDTVTDASGGELAVVGTVVIPPNFDSADTDRGAVLTPAGLDAALVGDGYDALLLRYEPGVDRLSVEAELAEGGARLTVVRPPGALANVQSTTWITQVLAAYFALLGLAGLAHGIVVSTRRSRGDTAVVTTLGFERTEVRRSVVLQATFLTAVGLVAGVPIGLVLGRAAWRWVVDGIGVIELAATPVAAALALVPLAVALAALVAIVPAWSAARRRPALDLRAE
jgi:hypothetical protein